MTLLDRLLGREPVHRPVALASPFSESSLSPVVLADIFGAEVAPMSRALAMSVPAVARGRSLLTSTVSAMPLRLYREATPVEPQPLWLYRTSGQQSPQMRLLWTVDDLLFHGVSVWAVERDSSGRITEAARIDYSLWSFDPDGNVLFDDQPVTPESVVLFEGSHEGILSFGADTIRTAKRLERTAADRAANPTPTTELHQVTEDELTDEEIKALVDGYAIARRDPHGAIVYTPNSVELRFHGDTAGELLIGARNASAIDVARLMGIPAAMVDASNVSASLTYETVAGRNAQFLDYALTPYLTAITARLSMDDVSPRGTRVALDRTELTTQTPDPSGPPVED